MEVTRQELSKILGKTPKQVQNLINQGLPAKKVSGKLGYQIDTAEAVQWLLDQAAGKVVNYRSARARTLLASARLKELQYDQQNAQLVDGKELSDVLLPLVASAHKKLLSLPGKLASPIAEMEDPLDIEQILEETFRKALDQIADQGSGK